MPDSFWPAWWSWELEFSGHVVDSMEHRDFTEIDLRGMMEVASGLRPEARGRWAIQSRWRGRDWEIIVEPDRATEQLVVVTAYPVDKGLRWSSNSK